MGSRSRAYDFIRVVAMLMVVGIHSLVSPSGRIGPWYIGFMNATLFTCNAIFFMLSGRLNLKAREDTELPQYYYRKFTRILLPALIYMLLYTIYQNVGETSGISPIDIVKIFIINVLDKYDGGVYWFVYHLFGFVLAAPILAPVCHHRSRGKTAALLVLLVLFSLPSLLFYGRNVEFRWRFPISISFGLFLLGAMLDFDALVRQPRWKIFVPSVICIGITTALNRYGYPHYLVNGETSMYIVTSIGIFTLLYGLGLHVPESRALRFTAKHSFGVYLCHLPIV